MILGESESGCLGRAGHQIEAEDRDGDQGARQQRTLGAPLPIVLSCQTVSVLEGTPFGIFSNLVTNVDLELVDTGTAVSAAMAKLKGKRFTAWTLHEVLVTELRTVRAKSAGAGRRIIVYSLATSVGIGSVTVYLLEDSDEGRK